MGLKGSCQGSCQGFLQNSYCETFAKWIKTGLVWRRYVANPILGVYFHWSHHADGKKLVSN